MMRMMRMMKMTSTISTDMLLTLLIVVVSVIVAAVLLYFRYNLPLRRWMFQRNPQKGSIVSIVRSGVRYYGVVKQVDKAEWSTGRTDAYVTFTMQVLDGWGLHSDWYPVTTLQWEPSHMLPRTAEEFAKKEKVEGRTDAGS